MIKIVENAEQPFGKIANSWSNFKGKVKQPLVGF